MLMIRAYHRDQRDTACDVVIVPDSAHGTNLATAALAGCRVMELPSSSRALIDLAALRAAPSERTAALMPTNPNTRETKDAPEIVLEAPHATSVRRPEKVRAAREPVLRWRPPAEKAQASTEAQRTTPPPATAAR
jgi:hypothetical protein